MYFKSGGSLLILGMQRKHNRKNTETIEYLSENLPISELAPCSDVTRVSNLITSVPDCLTIQSRVQFRKFGHEQYDKNFK